MAVGKEPHKKIAEATTGAHVKDVQSGPSDYTVGALGAVTLKMEERCRKHAVQLRKCTES